MFSFVYCLIVFCFHYFFYFSFVILHLPFFNFTYFILLVFCSILFYSVSFLCYYFFLFSILFLSFYLFYLSSFLDGAVLPTEQYPRDCVKAINSSNDSDLAWRKMQLSRVLLQQKSSWSCHESSPRPLLFCFGTEGSLVLTLCNWGAGARCTLQQGPLHFRNKTSR